MVPPTSIDSVGSGGDRQGAPDTPQLEPSDNMGVSTGGAVSWQTFLPTLDCLDLRAVIKEGTATCPWVPTQLCSQFRQLIGEIAHAHHDA
eukprot:11104573-Prorocentrum_lima.AAC.1